MSNITRRQFIKRTAAAGAACSIGFPSLIRAQGLNEKLQVGFIAAGGRAGAHTGASHEAGLVSSARKAGRTRPDIRIGGKSSKSMARNLMWFSWRLRITHILLLR